MISLINYDTCLINFFWWTANLLLILVPSRIQQQLILQHQMLHPTTKWAQRKDRIFIELHLMDITNEKVDLTPTHLNFEGESGGKKYAFQLELFDEVIAEESKWSKTGFHMLFALQKKKANAAFWPRLVKSTQKNQYIQVDWAKWVDEDEEEEDPNKGLGGFDPNQMQNFGGAPDEDDEEGNLDDLDKEEELEGEKKEE